MRTWLRKVLAVTVAAGLLVGCTLTSSRSDAPALSSAYDDLTAYWEAISTSLDFPADAALLGEWRLAYDEGGAVRYLRLVLHVDRGTGTHDVYHINQDENLGEGSRVTWRRSQSELPSPVAAVPAAAFLARAEPEDKAGTAGGPDTGSTAARPGESPPIYLLPRVGCVPEPAEAGERAPVWVCPEHR